MDEKVAIILADQLQKIYSMDFYKRKLDQAGVKASDIKTLDDFKKIPFTTSPEYFIELKKRPPECSLYVDDVTRINLSPSGQELYLPRQITGVLW